MNVLLYQHAKKQGIKLKTKNAFGQLMTTLHYVSQGFALVVHPSSATFHLESSQQIRAIEITEPKLYRDVYVQVVASKAQDPAVNTVYELIREVTANMHYQGCWRGELLDNKYTRSVSL